MTKFTALLFIALSISVSAFASDEQNCQVIASLSTQDILKFRQFVNQLLIEHADQYPKDQGGVSSVAGAAVEYSRIHLDRTLTRCAGLDVIR